MATKKPAPKSKTPAKKSAPAKAKAKPTAKAAPKKPAKAAQKPAKAVKPVAKKPIPAKKPAKPAARAAAKKPVAVKNPVHKPMSKKVEVKKPAAKAPVKKEAPKKEAPKKEAPKVSQAMIKAKDIKVGAPKHVVLPKISTKTSRKYQPDFTKSVLDQPIHDPGAPIVRYSDAELNEFRELIQRKLESAKKELAYLQGLITRKDEMGGDNDDARYMTMEDGSMSMEREQLSQMASRQITFIDHLEKALMRIENKTYGICRVTGRLIDKARLRAVPHATLSIEAKMGAVK